MSAIITDQLRILNSENFVAGRASTTNSYYAGIGLPNPTDFQSDWSENPPSPKDSFSDENDYWASLNSCDTIISNCCKCTGILLNKVVQTTP